MKPLLLVLAVLLMIGFFVWATYFVDPEKDLSRFERFAHEGGAFVTLVVGIVSVLGLALWTGLRSGSQQTTDWVEFASRSGLEIENVGSWTGFERVHGTLGGRRFSLAVETEVRGQGGGGEIEPRTYQLMDLEIRGAPADLSLRRSEAHAGLARRALVAGSEDDRATSSSGRDTATGDASFESRVDLGSDPSREALAWLDAPRRALVPRRSHGLIAGAVQETKL